MAFNKQKLLDDLKAQIGSIEGLSDKTLLPYQIGRNAISQFFYIEIASGKYDEPESK